MSADSNKALVLRYIEEVLNAGNITVADEIVAEDFVTHTPYRSDRTRAAGREGVKQFAAGQRAASPDWHITVEDIVAAGDRVVVRGTGKGTLLREFFGVLAGTTSQEEWIAIYRVEAGRISESWVGVLSGRAPLATNTELPAS